MPARLRAHCCVNPPPLGCRVQAKGVKFPLLRTRVRPKGNRDRKTFRSHTPNLWTA